MARWIAANVAILIGLLFAYFFLAALIPIEGTSSSDTFASRLEAGFGSFLVWSFLMTPMAVVHLVALWRLGSRMEAGSLRPMALVLSPITGLLVAIVLLIDIGTFPVAVAIMDLVIPLLLFGLLLKLPPTGQPVDGERSAPNGHARTHGNDS